MSTSATSSPPTPLPPHTVRIKRKRNQDPLQALILNQDSSSKRSRTNSYVFKLATTEQQPRRPGAITLLEAPILPDDPSPSSLPTTTTTTSSSSAREQASGILKAARDILSPARLFRFPTRKRRISNDNDLESSAKPTESSSRKRTRATPVSQSEKIRSSNTAQGSLPPPPIKPAEDSIARQTPRATAGGGIPKVKVLATPPPARSPMPSSSSSITTPAPVPVPITGVRTNTTTASGEPARRRRRSSGSLSLSPTTSYQQMSTANEEELQHMVDIYLQLNSNNNSSSTSDSPSGEKNAGNQTKLTSELKRPNRASSRRASLKAASEAVPEAVIVDDEEEEHETKLPADDEGLVHKAPVVSSIIKEEEAVDGEVEDYVYDVYYREKMLGSTWEGGQYGLLLYNSEQDFEDLIFDENDDGDSSDYGLSDDEDSNAEDYYRNDYPDEEDFEEEEDEETEFVSEGRSGLGAEEEEGGEAEIDADDFDGYEYEECAPRFADDDGDRSMEGGVGLQDIMELEDSAESDSDFAERILGSLRQKDGYEDAEEE